MAVYVEPEVHIIEKYFQEVLHCFTMTNIRCKGNKEIDLLAINPRTLEKYHVEARISVSKSFALREKDTYTSKGKAYRIGLDYFSEKKFNHPMITEKIRQFFGESDYHKVLVVWHAGNLPAYSRIALEKYGFDVWALRNIFTELVEKGCTSGSRDDVIRVVELLSLYNKEIKYWVKRIREI